MFAALRVVEQLFDHVPDTVFFVKGLDGLYRLVNRSLVERCGLRSKSELLGRHVRAIFPNELGGRYAAQDEAVFRSGRPIEERLELHWYPNRQTGWCLTTKLPLRMSDGRVVGLPSSITRAGLSYHSRRSHLDLIQAPSRSAVIGRRDWLSSHT